MNTKKTLRPELGLTSELGVIPIVPLLWAASVPLTAWLVTRKMPEPLPPEERGKEMPLWIKLTIGGAVVAIVYVVAKKKIK